MSIGQNRNMNQIALPNMIRVNTGGNVPPENAPSGPDHFSNPEMEPEKHGFLY